MSPRRMRPRMVRTLIEAGQRSECQGQYRDDESRGAGNSPNQNSHSPKARVPRKLIATTTARQIVIHAEFCDKVMRPPGCREANAYINGLVPV